MKIPDWLFYLLVIAALLYGCGNRGGDRLDERFEAERQAGGFQAPDDPEDTAPPAEGDGDGAALPEPSRFDEQGLVDAENPELYSTGTAFAVAPGGGWLTASHVVRGCPTVGLISADQETAVRVRRVLVSSQADVAWLDTDGGPQPFAMDLDESDLRLNALGFHVGFPQGLPGEVVTRLMGRQTLETRGAWRSEEDTLTWAEVARTPGLRGSLGGLSGGPVFDSRGRALGVTIAENPRRGRVITTAAVSVTGIVEDGGLTLDGDPAPPLDPDAFTSRGDRLRDDRRVMQVVCLPE
jgi:serine protease Do